MKAFLYVSLGFYLVLMALLAYFAHQNNDDPANWINWSVFRTFLGGGLLVAIIVLIVMWFLKDS